MPEKEKTDLRSPHPAFMPKHRRCTAVLQYIFISLNWVPEIFWASVAVCFFRGWSPDSEQNYTGIAAVCRLFCSVSGFSFALQGDFRHLTSFLGLSLCSKYGYSFFSINYLEEYMEQNYLFRCSFLSTSENATLWGSL